jgi:hypothetical protein
MTPIGMLRRDRIEADIGEEDRGRSAGDSHAGDLAEKAVRREWLEVLHLHDRYAQGDEQHQGHDLDGRQHRVDGCTRARADDQQCCHQQANRYCGHIDQAADEWTAREGVGNVDAERSLQQADEVVRPTHRHGARCNGVLEDQPPAHQPGNELAEHDIGIRVRGTGDRHHRRELGVTQRGECTSEGSEHERHHHARPGFLRSLGGQHENARADDRPHSQHDQLKGAERAAQRLVLGGGEHIRQRLDAPVHRRPGITTRASVRRVA